MKKINLFLLLLTLTVSVIPAAADQSSPQGGSRPPIVLTRGHGQGLSNTPKAPDRQVITCNYDGETLTLNFVYSEGMCILSIMDEEAYEYSYSIDTSALFVQIPVGILLGKVRIQLETGGNKLFSGTMD